MTTTTLPDLDAGAEAFAIQSILGA